MPHTPGPKGGTRARILALVQLAAMLCAASLAMAACGRNETEVDAFAGPPYIRLVSPQQGDTLADGSVVIRVDVENFMMDPDAIGLPRVPGRGHWHVFLNGDWVAASADAAYFLQGIPPGAHHLEVTLANNDHSPVLPTIRDFAIVQVMGEEAPPDEAAASLSEEEYALPDMVASNHFVSSSPEHGEELYGSPDSITVNFDFRLAPESSIVLTREGELVPLGALQLSPDTLSMSAPVMGELGEGVYEVNYRACWPFLNCHSGSFAFIVEGE